MAQFKTRIETISFLSLCFIASACRADSVKSLEKQSFEVCGTRFDLELARSSSERNKGLMFREEVDPKSGMIFVFTQATPQTFWMKNVPIALDILFFDSKGHILNSITMPPESPMLQDMFLKRHSSTGAAQFVVELREGTLKKFESASKLKKCKLSPLPTINEKVEP